MKLKDLKDVLTFAAFLPESDDSTAAWSKRFPGKRTLLLNIGKDSTSWRVMDKKGVIGEAGKMEGPFKEVLTQMGEEWRSLADDGWCAVSLNSRFVISLEINLSRRQGVEEVLRTNPKAALGAKAVKFAIRESFEGCVLIISGGACPLALLAFIRFHNSAASDGL